MSKNLHSLKKLAFLSSSLILLSTTTVCAMDTDSSHQTKRRFTAPRSQTDINAQIQELARNNAIRKHAQSQQPKGDLSASTTFDWSTSAPSSSAPLKVELKSTDFSSHLTPKLSREIENPPIILSSTQKDMLAGRRSTLADPILDDEDDEESVVDQSSLSAAPQKQAPKLPAASSTLSLASTPLHKTTSSVREVSTLSQVTVQQKENILNQQGVKTTILSQPQPKPFVWPVFCREPASSMLQGNINPPTSSFKAPQVQPLPHQPTPSLVPTQQTGHLQLQVPCVAPQNPQSHNIVSSPFSKVPFLSSPMQQTPVSPPKWVPFLTAEPEPPLSVEVHEDSYVAQQKAQQQKQLEEQQKQLMLAKQQEEQRLMQQKQLEEQQRQLMLAKQQEQQKQLMLQQQLETQQKQPCQHVSSRADRVLAHGLKHRVSELQKNGILTENDVATLKQHPFHAQPTMLYHIVFEKNDDLFFRTFVLGGIQNNVRQAYTAGRLLRHQLYELAAQPFKQQGQMLSEMLK